jgi:hypothetical protein
MLKSYRSGRFDHHEEVTLMLVVLMIPLTTLHSMIF